MTKRSRTYEQNVYASLFGNHQRNEKHEVVPHSSKEKGLWVKKTKKKINVKELTERHNHFFNNFHTLYQELEGKAKALDTIVQLLASRGYTSPPLEAIGLLLDKVEMPPLPLFILSEEVYDPITPN